eukprot:3139881-Pyramimonas_sp.AAC.1
MQLWALSLYAPHSEELPRGPRNAWASRNLSSGRTRKQPLGPSVEFPMGPSVQIPTGPRNV